MMQDTVCDITYNFSSKNFVITGASSGIGRQTAIDLAKAGANVLIIARREAELQLVKNEYPDKIFIGCCDVTNYDELEDNINNFVAKQGKLDGCVHAAGIVEFTPLRLYDEEKAKKIMDISFWAGVKLVQLCTKVSRANKGTSNILFSSSSGNKGEKGMFAYSSAKAAVKVAVKSIAQELADKKHRINTISPGFVRSQMTEDTIISDDLLKRYLLGAGLPADISGVVLFLLSSQSAWITGSDIIVDGGYMSS